MRLRITYVFVFPPFVSQNRHLMDTVCRQFHVSFDPVCGQFAVSFAHLALGDQPSFEPPPHLWTNGKGGRHKRIGYVAVGRAGVLEINQGVIGAAFLDRQSDHAR
jgi:hypothetical protein